MCDCTIGRRDIYCYRRNETELLAQVTYCDTHGPQFTEHQCRYFAIHDASTIDCMLLHGAVQNVPTLVKLAIINEAHHQLQRHSELREDCNSCQNSSSWPHVA